MQARVHCFEAARAAPEKRRAMTAHAAAGQTPSRVPETNNNNKTEAKTKNKTPL
jgi:hypothetical protein